MRRWKMCRPGHFKPWAVSQMEVYKGPILEEVYPGIDVVAVDDVIERLGLLWNQLQAESDYRSALVILDLIKDLKEHK